MSQIEPRILPLPMSEWGEKEKEALSVFLHPGRKSLQKKDDEPKDMSALALLLNHPEMAKAVFTLTDYLLQSIELSARDRELLVLRVAWHRKAEYEWAQHVVICQIMGMPDDEIARVAQAEISADWSEKDAMLMAAADELVASAFVSDTTWKGLSGYYNKHELMDIIVAVGAYDLMAMLFNSTGMPSSDQVKEILSKFPM